MCPEPTTAVVIGSTAVGANESRKARKSASRSVAAATAAEAEANAAQLAFEKKKYNDWKKVYGPVEKNLAKYYKNLSPGKYAAKGLTAFNEERVKMLTALEEDFAQRGITNSGVAGSVMLQESMQAAETRAGIRMDAKDKVQGMRADFLSIGLGHKPDLGRTLEGQAQRAGDFRSEALSNLNAVQRSEAAATQNLITQVGTGIADYLDKPKNPEVA